MTVSMYKTLAALKLPTQVPALLCIGEAIVVAMTDNPTFPDPTPPIATIASALADLRSAQVVTLTNARGSAAARNEKRVVVVGLLVRLKAYVQGVADDDPLRAPAIIQSAGLNVKRIAPPMKVPFEVRPGAVSGSVRIAVRAAADKASYQWAWSTDEGGTWRSTPTTLQAKTAIAGLASGSTCSFRYRAVTWTGETDWSEPVSILVR